MMQRKPSLSPRARGALIGAIHAGATALGMDTSDKDPRSTYRAMLQEIGGTPSCAKMSDGGLHRVMDHLRRSGFQPQKSIEKKDYPGRPKNADRGNRAAQMQKIEALLTIGGLPWSYADAIAKQMRLADKVAWVAEDNLYRIITALRKKAQKEHWDLSGEK